MPRKQTLKNLRDRFRELGEHRSSYISDAAFLREANQARLELFEKLVSAGSDDYAEKEHLIDVVSGTSSYDLPADFFKSIGVDVLMSSGDWVAIRSYGMAERHIRDRYIYGSTDRVFTQYRIRGDKIYLSPEPNWSETDGLRMWYVPVPEDMVEDGDVVDGVCGWEDWIVYKCLILFAGKEESDPSLWIQLLNQLNQRIDDMQIRDRGNTERIRDVDREDWHQIFPRYGVSI